MPEFEEQYSKLNAKQKQAVDAVDGPVLVLAGPGTGKTELLSVRVANILRKTDASPSNVLCLTFTNKASTNIRDRLLKLVGPESTGVNVNTFHGFAAEIMRDHPDYFWNGARLSTAPDALQLDLIQNILMKLPLSNPLSMVFAGKYTMVSDVKRALGLVKEEGLTPEKLKAIIKNNLEYIDIIEPKVVEILSQNLRSLTLDELRDQISELPEQGIDATIAPLKSLGSVIKESLDTAIKLDEGTGKKTHTSKWKGKIVQSHTSGSGMHTERKNNQWWLSFSDVYEEYRNQLHQLGYYDYSDMLLEVIVQLEQKEELRASVQEQFQYVLIDEFQDCNSAQIRFAHLIADHHSANGRPNIMAVGDDDQCIFGFSGAELNHILIFKDAYKDTENIVLEDNYRSSQAILDTSSKVIDQAEDRLINHIPGLTKELIAKNEPEAIGAIKHFEFQTREHQLSDIARQIQKQQISDPTLSIAVLARSHNSLIQIAGILSDLNVNIRYEKQSNILEHEIVIQVIRILKLLDAITSGNKDLVNQLIAESIYHPMWQIKPNDLWDLATVNFKKRDWLQSLRENDVHDLQVIGDWLFWLAKESTYQPLPKIIEYVIGLGAGPGYTSPIRSYHVTGKEATNQYIATLSALRTLRQMAAEFSASESPKLSDLLDYININADNEEVVSDQSVFTASAGEVDLLSVHKAKGLEFDCVFIIDAVENNWKPKNKGRKSPSNLKLQKNGEVEDDYIRLLYVACTRAKHTLIVSSYSKDSKNDPVLAVPFIRNAIPETVQIEATETPVQKVLEENLMWPRLSYDEELSKLGHTFDNYQLSATGMLNFLDITRGGPVHFFKAQILKLPYAQGIPAAFGNAFHAAMQMAQKLTNQDAFELQKVQDWFERSLELEYLLKDDHEKFVVHGKEMLERLFVDYGFSLKKGSLAEQELEGVKLQNALIKGKIDDFNIEDNSATITDYKTGGAVNNFNTKDASIAIRAWKHKSQLIFYAVLLKHHPKYDFINKVYCQMLYVSAKEQKELIRGYEPTTEDIERMEKLIEKIWDKIQNLDFPETSRYPEDISGIKQFEDDLINGSI